MALTAGHRFGAYEIQAPLGAGGMGEVYRARDPRLRRDVAIKVLPESFTLDADRIARFEREARMLAALNCPNIASIYGIEESNPSTGSGQVAVRGLVLELVEGPTLAERLRDGALPVNEVLDIAAQIVHALDAAHEKGIVHRDLKPANIKVTPDGMVKVLDFGLAKGGDEGSMRDLTLSPTITADGTRAGVILGTAAYMSPEQARGRVVDKRTDVWAFGCVLYEMLTGRMAFAGETVSDVIAAIIGSEPDWNALPGSTPPALRRLLPRLLDKDVKRRVRDIGDVRFELDEARRGPGTVESASPRSSRAWRIVALGSLAALIGAIVVASGVVGRREVASQGPAVGQAVVSQLTSYDGTEASGAISPDGRSFVFTSDQGGTPDIWLRQVAGGDPVRLTNDAAVESGLVYAPDGETVYFSRAEGTNSSIGRIGALGGQARKIVNDARAPAPSPDGRQLAWFALGGGGAFTGSLVAGGVDGANARVLVTNVLSVVELSRAAWSPDGRRLAYSSGGLFAPRNLFVVEVAGGQPRQVTKFTHSTEGTNTQAWLPDGRHLVVSYFPSTRAQGTGDIGILDVDTGAIVRLSTNVAASFDAPSLSADGSRMVVTSSDVQREIWKVPFGPDPIASGRNAVRLLDTAADPMWAYVTRDGGTLLFNNALVGSRNLWTMPLDGSGKPRQITSIPGDAVMHASLSPDGAHVAFASSATGNSDVWVQHVEGSGLRQLTDDTAAEAWPVWSPDGKWIMFASLRDGSWETRRVSPDGGGAEKVMDGFFRGDWIRQPDNTGTWVVTSTGVGGLRLVDFEERRVLWQDRPPGNGMPMFSPDGRSVSLAVRESRDRDAIWVYDAVTGTSRVAVRFSQPFQLFFRVSWVDNGRAFIVNRVQMQSHIVLFDRFWTKSQ